MRRAVAVVAVLAVAGGGLVLTVGPGGSPSTQAAQTAPEVATATVERRTLVEQDEVEGTLGYGDAEPLTNRGQGTVTRRAELGSVVERNGVLYQLDGRPVRLLYGTTPAYRRLAEGVADGDDVEQLERNLKDMGFAKGLITMPDTRWDAATTAAVKRWEKSLKVDQDGVIEDGEVVFAPGPVRVAAHEADLGSAAQPGAPVLEVTGTTRQVDVDLDARKQRLARQGAKVEVELPDGTTTTGTIASVGTVATSAGDGDAAGGGGSGGGGGDDDEVTIPVTIVLDDPAVGGSLDGAPVEVRLVRASREGVLVVPVNALLALAEGGYAVEVVNGAERRLVGVETGLFSKGMVEVTGDGLTEGTQVVVPR